PDAPAPEMAPERLDHDTLVEYVRSWAIFRLKHTSLRDLEEESSVAKSSIDKFVKRQALPNKIWPKLRLWFLNDRRSRFASLQDPADMVLLMLESVANLPDDRLGDALLRTADHYEELHRQAHAPTPEWIGAVRTMVREGGLPARDTTPTEYPLPRRRGRKRKHAPDPSPDGAGDPGDAP
ncbi:MAG TPA: hypothetical protein VFH27_01375, partial [Longimicrobiaceae bacterium]|nr:hypothetical protein [Longimicrobiaceae bacterium]